MCLSLAAEKLVSVTSDPDAVLRGDHGDNSDVRIGVYRAISSSRAVDLGSGILPALREQFAREGDPNCLTSLLDAARAIPEDNFDFQEDAKQAWFEASIGLLERLGGSLGEEERAAGFELCGRFYSPSTTTDDANVR